MKKDIAAKLKKKYATVDADNVDSTIEGILGTLDATDAAGQEADIATVETYPDAMAMKTMLEGMPDTMPVNIHPTYTAVFTKVWQAIQEKKKATNATNQVDLAATLEILAECFKLVLPDGWEAQPGSWNLRHLDFES